VLNAEVGEFLTVARRKGNEWYVGTINNSTVRELKIPLDFLPLGTFNAELYSDGPETAKDPNGLVKVSRSVTNTGFVTVKMEPGGGQVMRLLKQ